jgi:spore germination protein YaaH
MTRKNTIGLAALVALSMAGCGAATVQNRRTTTVAASAKPSDPVAPGAPASPPTVAPAGARAPRPIGASADVTRAVAQDRVSLWLPYWTMGSALHSALANPRPVGTAFPFWYAIAGDSSIEENPGAGDRSVISELQSRGIRVVPTVTEGEGMRDFDRMLASAHRRAAMVHALLTIARSRAYSGLDLDFEEFAIDRRHDSALANEAAARYPGFVGEVCAALHAIARTCMVTVMPRTSGRAYWRKKLATWVYDYAALFRVADRVQIMAYDEHAPGEPAGPVAAYPWVEQVVAYAGSVMPPAKADLGLPAYGYDWSGREATSITSREAPQLAGEHGTSPRWDAAQAEDTFHYTGDGRRHTVWYEGARAEYDRARLAKEAGFAGVDLWAAGGEEAAVWPMLRALYAR